MTSIESEASTSVCVLPRGNYQSQDIRPQLPMYVPTVAINRYSTQLWASRSCHHSSKSHETKLQLSSRAVMNTFEFSSILFAPSSFLEGFGRAMDLGCTMDQYNESQNPAAADQLALQADWAAVAADFSSVVEQHALCPVANRLQ